MFDKSVADVLKEARATVEKGWHKGGVTDGQDHIELLEQQVLNGPAGT